MPASRGIRSASQPPTSPKGKRRRLGLKLIAISLALIAAVLLIDRQIRPIITSMASYQAKVYATRVINEAVSNQVKDFGYTYENLSKITTNAEDNITSIQVNSLNINAIHTSITNAITRDMAMLDTSDLKIPLGSLTGFSLFSGRGPYLTIQLTPRGYVRTKIISQFTEAGINQTNHRILLSATVEMAAIVPGYNTSVEVTTEYVLAETIIVGTVPNYFTKVVSDNQKLVNDINDYGSQNSGNWNE